MKLTCCLCSKEYIMDPIKIPDAGFRVGCSRCGAKITVLLPEGWREFDKEELVSGLDQVTKAAGNDKYILVADDTEFFRTMMSDLLISKGFNVKVAADGLDAMEMIMAAPEAFQLVLLDLQMPRMSGFDVLEKLKDSEIQVPPILVMTGVHDSHEDMKLVRQMGAAGYLDKSLDPPVAFERIKMVIDAQNNRDSG